MGIRLHQWEISPFCGKVRKILALKSLDYECVNYNGLAARKAAKLTEAGKLPVLEHDGQLISDSSNIAAYLEALSPQPAVYPEHPADRAQAHFWEDWADESLYWFEVYFRFGPFSEAREKAFDHLCQGRPGYEKALMRMVAGPTMRRQLRTQGIGRYKPKEVEARFNAHCAQLSLLLRDKQWLVGDRQSMADIAITAQLDEMLRTSHLRDRILAVPHLGEWLARNRSPFL